jgi:hypothetical protein
MGRSFDRVAAQNDVGGEQAAFYGFKRRRTVSECYMDILALSHQADQPANRVSSSTKGHSLLQILDNTSPAVDYELLLSCCVRILVFLFRMMPLHCSSPNCGIAQVVSHTGPMNGGANNLLSRTWSI